MITSELQALKIRLEKFWQLNATDKNQAKEYYDQEIYPIFAKAILHGNAEFYDSVADFVKRQE